MRLHSAAAEQMLSPLATLRPPNGVRATCLDVLFPSAGRPACWAIASEHQQVCNSSLITHRSSLIAHRTPLIAHRSSLITWLPTSQVQVS